MSTRGVVWPAVVAELGRQTVGPFTGCRDCEDDPPADEVVKVVGAKITTPGQRGTFTLYGAVALCYRHARQRTTAGPVAAVLSAFGGVVVDRWPTP